MKKWHDYKISAYCEECKNFVHEIDQYPCKQCKDIYNNMKHLDSPVYYRANTRIQSNYYLFLQPKIGKHGNFILGFDGDYKILLPTKDNMDKVVLLPSEKSCEKLYDSLRLYNTFIMKIEKL